VNNFPRVPKKVPKSQAEPAGGTRLDSPLVLTLGTVQGRRSKTYSSAGHIACLTDRCTDRYNWSFGGTENLCRAGFRVVCHSIELPLRWLVLSERI
jgi:hypothetical protein